MCLSLGYRNLSCIKEMAKRQHSCTFGRTQRSVGTASNGEMWVLQKKYEIKINAEDTISRRIYGVSSVIEFTMKTYTVKKNVLNWLGHVKRMNDERMTKKMYDRKVSSKRGKGPRLTFEYTVS